MRHLLATVLAVFSIAGCGAGPDLDKARMAVKTSLDQWKQGSTPDKLNAHAIVIAEPDWQASYRLLDYELKDASAQPQQGPRVVAMLHLQDRAGKKLSKEVAYEVIFGDPVKIGRDAFHVGQ